MKKLLEIRAVKSNMTIPDITLENYINNFPNKRSRKNTLDTVNSFSNHFENIEVCSAHAPVTGTVEIVFSVDRKDTKSVNLPITTGFFFTCTRGRKNLYKVNWSCSMS